MNITDTDIDNLSTKLANLDLTDGERAALDTALDAASVEEVAGFASVKPGDPEGLGGGTRGYTEVEWTYRTRLRSGNGFMKLGDIKNGFMKLGDIK